MFPIGFTLFGVLRFFLHRLPSFFLSRVFYAISSKTANVCVFGDFSIHNKDWLTLVELTDLVNSVITFLKCLYLDGLLSYTNLCL